MGQIVDTHAKGSGQRTSWRWRGSVMVSDCRGGCKGSRKTYVLEVERGRDGVRLWMQMQREQGNVRPGGGDSGYESIEPQKVRRPTI
jgi:hypothetical protein